MTLSLPAMTFEEASGKNQLWPKNIIVTKETQATLIENGQEVGIGKIRSGTKCKLISVDIPRESLVIDQDGSQALIPVANSDFIDRVESVGQETQAQNTSAPASDETVTPSPSAPSPEESSPHADPAPPVSSFIRQTLEGKLVYFDGNKLQKYDASKLAGVKYYALYYSAHWCPPCRQFTPSLVSTYNSLKNAHPEWEVIFISSDRSAADMQNYMKETGMTFPAVSFGMKMEANLSQYAGGRGIPNLVFMDANGKIISSSYVQGEYVGPQVVLESIKNHLSR